MSSCDALRTLCALSVCLSVSLVWCVRVFMNEAKSALSNP